MNPKDALRSPLKPILDLLDRRVYNLARLIDAKTEELKAPLAAAALNGSNAEPVVAGLGHVRQDLAGVDQRLTHQVHSLARTTLSTQESYLESLSYVGRALREIRDEIAAAPAEMETISSRITAAVDHLASEVATRGIHHRDLVDLRAEFQTAQAEMRAQLTAIQVALAPGAPPAESDLALSQLDASRAQFANYVDSHRGFAAQAGLWINHPIQTVHTAGTVRVDSVNERIVEVPFVFASLAGLPAGSRVLDVGGMESSVALSLASLGYAVTVVDPRGYPFAHSSLRVVASTVEALSDPPASFDAIVCLSTIEHIGLGAYGVPRQPDEADRAAMKRMHELAKPGAILALTVPFGVPSVDAFQRTYDRPWLDSLLGGWQVSSFVVATQRTPTEWTVGGDGSGDANARQVALVTARAS